jgi:guanylate kinase
MIILVGASASGKTAVGRTLESTYGIKKVVTYTTREKREKEIDGIDYHFISSEKFKELEKSHFFYESIEYNGNFYGTSKESLKENSYIICDSQGLKTYKQGDVKSIAFFLDCYEDVRKERMAKRGDSAFDIEKRIEIDRETFDIRNVNQADYFVDANEDSIDLIAKKIYLVYKEDMANAK